MRDKALGQLAGVLGSPRADRMTIESRLAEDLGLDSLELLEFVLVVEDTYGVVLGEEYFEGLLRVEDLLVVCETIAANNAASREF